MIAATARALAVPQVPGRSPVDEIAARLAEGPEPAGARQLRARHSRRRRRSPPACSRTSPTSASWPPAERRCGSATSGCIGSPGSTPSRPPRCSWSGPRRRSTTTPRSPRSSRSSTGCRWRSSSRPGCARSRSPSWRAGCANGCRCWAKGRATRPRGNARSRRPSRGATTCSRRPSSACCGSSRCSPAASTRRPPRRWPGRRRRRPCAPRLVDASLLAADPPRYRLLITVRTFARERLREAGEEEAARERHRDTYLALAELVGAQHDRPWASGPGWCAVGSSTRTSCPRCAGRSTAATPARPSGWPHGSRSSGSASVSSEDGRALLERAMAIAGPGGPLWPRALFGRAMLAAALGSPDATRRAADAAVAGARGRPGRRAAGGRALLAGVRVAPGGPRAEARADLERARAIAVAVGQRRGHRLRRPGAGRPGWREGDLDAAADLLVRARDRYRRSRVTIDAGYMLIDLARVRLAQQRFDDALVVAGEALADFRSREDPRGVAGALRCLGQAYEGLGQPERARPALDESRALVERWGVGLVASGQPDEPGQEPALGAGVEALADVRTECSHRLQRTSETATLVSPRNCGDPESPVHSPPSARPGASSARAAMWFSSGDNPRRRTPSRRRRARGRSRSRRAGATDPRCRSSSPSSPPRSARRRQSCPPGTSRRRRHGPGGRGRSPGARSRPRRGPAAR